MKQKYSYCIYITGFLLLFLLLFFVSFSLGRYPITPSELMQVLISRITNRPLEINKTIETVILHIRLPRIILATLVGGALSAAGACYQGIFQNAMASPDILGASSGAAFGAALAIILRLEAGAVTIFSFAFSLLTVLLTLFISRKMKGKQVVGIILAGIMMSNFVAAGTSFLKLVADPMDQLPSITYWLMGSFSSATYKDIAFVLPLFVIGVFPMIISRYKLNVLTLGDDAAQTMGVNPRIMRMIIILSATLLTSASVSVSGTIGWVGLVIPNMCRRMVGSDYRKLLFLSILVGSVFMLGIDTLARTLVDAELPLSILTGFIGAPFFIYLMTRKGEK